MSFGLMQVTMVVGPALGGLVIEYFGLAVPYFVDAVSVLGMVVAAWALTPQPPPEQPRAATVKAIRSGLRFVSRLQGLMASFVIDLLAMTFGMPRALFPILSINVFHTGAFGAGILNSAVAAGATVAALTTGWMSHARRLGRIVLGAVAVWGLAIATAGFMTSLWPAAVLFALAGAADSVSAVCRTTITQTLTPDAMRGRVSAVFSLVVASGPRLGDVESGTVAAVTSPKFSVVSGGLALAWCRSVRSRCGCRHWRPTIPSAPSGTCWPRIGPISTRTRRAPPCPSRNAHRGQERPRVDRDAAVLPGKRQRARGRAERLAEGHAGTGTDAGRVRGQRPVADAAGGRGDDPEGDALGAFGRCGGLERTLGRGHDVGAGGRGDLDLARRADGAGRRHVPDLATGRLGDREGEVGDGRRSVGARRAAAGGSPARGSAAGCRPRR